MNGSRQTTLNLVAPPRYRRSYITTGIIACVFAIDLVILYLWFSSSPYKVPGMGLVGLAGLAFALILLLPMEGTARGVVTGLLISCAIYNLVLVWYMGPSAHINGLLLTLTFILPILSIWGKLSLPVQSYDSGFK